MFGFLKGLLFEAVSKNRIINAMKNRTVVMIYYDDPKSGILPGYRYIEIYAYGSTKKGNPAIIGWLRNEKSQTLKSGKRNDAIRWRIFRLDRITSMQNTNQKYDTSTEYVSANRQPFNLQYKTLPNIIYKIVPGEIQATK